MTRNRAIVAAAVFLTAAVACLVVIALSMRGPERVETLGTLDPVPATAVPPDTVVPGTLPPATEAPTTTVAPAPSTTSPPVTARPAPPTTRPAPRPAPPAPAPVPAEGFHLAVPAIGVDAEVVAVGVQPGTNAMEIPDIDHVGWYKFGVLPGDAEGTAVLVGHVDGNGRPGVFSQLRTLVPGDPLTVTLPDGSTRAFVVSGREEFNKQALPADLFRRDGSPRLALITCGGPFDRATGHYVDNVVVVATPA